MNLEQPDGGGLEKAVPALEPDVGGYLAQDT